ncbi:DUF3093 domain-containing protein [Leifsonia bigeumensis]|uniref:DUF3093 domain-containing protein n=1 Tax=Leifsonella bigeumensis TaxID=433643 RepID=A0ABP7FST5_9MICO
MTIYREKLWASAWVFLSMALVIPASLLVFWPIDVTTGIVVAIVLYAGCCGILVLASPVIAVTDREFTAGRARLPLEFAGEATAYREPEATAQRGVDLDARAWLLIRGWVGPVVRIELTDPEDPTPYWLVSTRRPDALLAAFESAKAS